MLLIGKICTRCCGLASSLSEDDGWGSSAWLWGKPHSILGLGHKTGRSVSPAVPWGESPLIFLSFLVSSCSLLYAVLQCCLLKIHVHDWKVWINCSDSCRSRSKVNSFSFLKKMQIEMSPGICQAFLMRVLSSTSTLKYNYGQSFLRASCPVNIERVQTGRVLKVWSSPNPTPQPP